MSYEYKKIDRKKFELLINKYRNIQSDFLKNFNVDDIFSNSKIYEIIIANELDHILIPGHSGSKDAKDDSGRIYEYKHYKESSSNHTWTFNDFTDSTIEKLNSCDFVIFAHIDDSQYPEKFDWYYQVNGSIVSSYLLNATKKIMNKRKMINVSRNNLESLMNEYIRKIKNKKNGKYSQWLDKIYSIETKLEECVNVKNLLTSNKIWEVLIAVELNHNVNSEQGGRLGAHDAFDEFGNFYEYKVSKTNSWNFQDISDNVLNKYIHDSAIILAVVDKINIKVVAIYSANPNKVVKRLKEKLAMKIEKFRNEEKALRRLQVTLTKGDLDLINAKKIF